MTCMRTALCCGANELIRYELSSAFSRALFFHTNTKRTTIRKLNEIKNDFMAAMGHERALRPQVQILDSRGDILEPALVQLCPCFEHLQPCQLLLRPLSVDEFSRHSLKSALLIALQKHSEHISHSTMYTQVYWILCHYT